MALTIVLVRPLPVAGIVGSESHNIYDMEIERSSEQKRLPLKSSDRLSTLPGILIDEILKSVPIRDVVKTSAWSKFWRYRWMSVPILVFDSHSIPNSYTSEGQRHMKFVEFVTHVLFLHNKKLEKFGISNFLVSSYDVDRWILWLGQTLVKEVILEPKGLRYKMHSSLFSCQTLRILKLNNIILKLPSLEQGFKNLIELCLCKVTFTNETFAHLVLNSPLEKLTLIACDGYTQLKIRASNLSNFHLDGPGENIQFLNTSKLEAAYIDLHHIPSHGRLPRDLGASKLEFVLPGLLSVKKLHLSRHFIEVLATCTTPMGENLTYNQWRSLSVVINLSDPRENFIILYLLRRSPHLQKMDIKSISTRHIYLNENELGIACINPEDIVFPKLRTMELRCFKGKVHELDLIKLILMNAAMLDKVIITWDKDVQIGRAQVLESMMLFERRSPSAKVAFIS